MKIVWSKTAEKQLAKIDPRFRKRIESRLAGLDDNASPVADIKKLSSPENHIDCEWVITGSSTP